MPNRIVREGILRSRRIDALSDQAELFYRRLINVVDDYGRHETDPVLLRSDLYPLRINRVSDEDVTRWLSECTAGDEPLIFLYEVKGVGYLQVNNFDQRLRAMKSRCPQPLTSLSDKRQTNDRQPSVSGHVRNRNESESESETESAGIAEMIATPDGWDALTTAATKAQMSLDPSPSSDLCQKHWRRLSIEHRMDAVKGILARIDCGQYEDPAYVPTLDNYVRCKKWRESLRPRARTRSPDRKTVARLEAIRRIQEDLEDVERRKVHTG